MRTPAMFLLVLLAPGCAKPDAPIDPLEQLRREIKTAVSQAEAEGPQPNQRYLFVHKQLPIYHTPELAREGKPWRAVAKLPQGLYLVPPGSANKGVLGDPFPTGCFFELHEGENTASEVNAALFDFPNLSGLSNKFWTVKQLRDVIVPLFFKIREYRSALAFLAIRDTGGRFTFVGLSRPIEITDDRITLQARTRYNQRSEMVMGANVYRPTDQGSTLMGKIEFRWDGMKFSDIQARSMKHKMTLEHYEAGGGMGNID